MKSLKTTTEASPAIAVQRNSTEVPAWIARSIPELIERKHRLEAEISAAQVEMAGIDRHIEAVALRLVKSEEDESPDFSIFRDSTRRLLVNLWDAPNKMLSHEEIKDYVLFDESRSNNAVHDIVREARGEIEKQKFAYEIENVWGKGYQLVKRKIWEGLGKVPRTPKKQGKKA